MADHAVSDSPEVQAQLDRLTSLSPGADVLGLERITRLLANLGDPHLALPPVFHVAGTNGKGSTCAFLRAALQAEGYSVHAYTSPHLVRFNERIRLNDRLIDDARLAAYLERVLDTAGDIGPSFFEATTAAAFLAFAEHTADACIIEVGLGGRLDATNVIPAPAVCGIAQLGMDHEAFLGTDLKAIATEKAGIAKSGAPLVTLAYEPHIAGVIAHAAADAGARWLPMKDAWDAALYRERLHYRDEAGRIDTPLPRLAGPHQVTNLALALAMLRHQEALHIGEAALNAAPLWAHWPARLQCLSGGPLVARLGEARAIWLDGGHNPAAGEAIARFFDSALPGDERLTLLIGMLANKDVAGFLAPLRPHIGAIHSVPVEGHAHHGPEVFAAVASERGIAHSAHASLHDAADALAEADGPLLITGSLYLAGEVLKANDQLPD
ncbi:MAG: bifunctional folylpolyglutamate synthase/dihydrofolate synthase [Sphingobium sp.]|nr:bifunctional folylpolyglutamate synthase/dihydrofolate synthase [Sphingobium sp.]MBP6111463.1 bifunctional folylpolyglutamate synthase/dihydrofolate synthase [Sphingobium sp.]MBP8670125.1 bifunctional folylpolyglutamate synthase/dihydrofolate synthase [Sphingobium sp.]MBP9157370.1 bifunctional folylpolyglutamate synthase/dihydrofolate synthase [Sphingobium sp.]MCC6482935.1 bifunctional folylpolyglutamate synthase/dihydrofolate synthase [Sphingomonadaceae bacterium]